MQSVLRPEVCAMAPGVRGPRNRDNVLERLCDGCPGFGCHGQSQMQVHQTCQRQHLRSETQTTHPVWGAWVGGRRFAPRCCENRAEALQKQPRAAATAATG